jgi:hypothetical protein
VVQRTWVVAWPTEGGLGHTLDGAPAVVIVGFDGALAQRLIPLGDVQIYKRRLRKTIFRNPFQTSQPQLDGALHLIPTSDRPHGVPLSHTAAKRSERWQFEF